MKIEQVIALHLFNSKEVTLQGIGTFRLNPSISLPTDIEKDIVLPENAVSFDYNPKATEDASLIDSIVKHTTKIRPLASADLDDFLILGRQFLNIGKPFIIDKLGTLDKAQTGELAFIPGQFTTPKIEAPKALKENENEESSGLFNDYQREPESNTKRTFAVIAALVLAGLIGWGIYHFVLAKKPVEKSATAEIPPVTIPDSTAKKETAISVRPVTSAPEGTILSDSSFNVIIKQTDNKAEAIKYFNKLTRWGHHLVIYTPDSVHFLLAEVINLPLSDTARVKDSLGKFYATKVRIGLK